MATGTTETGALVANGITETGETVNTVGTQTSTGVVVKLLATGFQAAWARGSNIVIVPGTP